MRGTDTQQAGMFSYISPERRVPADHPLRPIRLMVDAALERLSPRFTMIWAIPPSRGDDRHHVRRRKSGTSLLGNARLRTAVGAAGEKLLRALLLHSTLCLSEMPGWKSHL